MSFLELGPHRRELEGVAEDPALQHEELHWTVELGNTLHVLDMYMFHFKLRDHLRAKLNHDLEHPEQQVMYCWVDWKERLHET
jgi:hypothetical protein